MASVERGGIEQIVTRILRDAKATEAYVNTDLKDIESRIETRLGITNLLTDDEVAEVQSGMVEYDDTKLIKMLVEKICVRIRLKVSG